MFAHSEQLSETYLMLLRSSNKSLKIPKVLNLNLKPGNQILSNALDIYKNTELYLLVGHSQNLKKFHGL